MASARRPNCQDGRQLGVLCLAPVLSFFGNDHQTPEGTGVRDYQHVVDLALGHAGALVALRNRPR